MFALPSLSCFKRMLCGAVVIVLSIRAAGASDLELLVVEAPACGACKLFEIQVGTLYARTDVGRRFPLRRLELGTYLQAGVSFTRPIVRVPTFVIIENRVEQHRFEGYSSDELFWMTLEPLVSPST